MNYAQTKQSMWSIAIDCLLNPFTTLTDHLRLTLSSFINNYQAIMWRLRECRLNDEQLANVLSLNSNAVRSRRARPELWKLADVKSLTHYFELSCSASVHLLRALTDLPLSLRELPDSERRQVERLVGLKVRQIEAFNRSDWPVSHLIRMHQSLLKTQH